VISRLLLQRNGCSGEAQSAKGFAQNPPQRCLPIWLAAQIGVDFPCGAVEGFSDRDGAAVASRVRTLEHGGEELRDRLGFLSCCSLGGSLSARFLFCGD